MEHRIKEAFEQGRSLGYKLVANVIVSYKNENETFILLLTRANTESNPGKEEPPGGKIDAHETALEGAKREVFEETGIVITDNIEFIACGDLTVDQKIVSRHFVFHARIVAQQEIVIDPQEHSVYRWAHIDKLEESKVHPKLMHIIKEFRHKF